MKETQTKVISSEELTKLLNSTYRIKVIDVTMSSSGSMKLEYYEKD